ncbi:hypothetical protein [Luteibacter sp.]|jgi:hypothetical protein|uniref:hypothetical protein n=1 Tax=Luteibacter sp. TaxID=1886636 RepID=UPI002F40FF77
MNTKAVLAVVVSGIALYQASNWWERAFATHKSSELSPDGCFRIDVYEPFWVLPSLLHRTPHPDPTVRNALFMGWELPVFKRAYEVSTGAFLGDTVVYDEAYAYDIELWNVAAPAGRRAVKVDGFLLFDSDRCADEATLARLAVGLDQRQKAIRLLHETWEEEDRQRALQSNLNK